MMIDMTQNYTRQDLLQLHPGEIIVDQFAGGGGASLGIRMATGRPPDIAVNHDPEAIAMHTVAHPETAHYIEDVWDVDPVEACAGRPVGLMHMSPTCTHFSKAKGDGLSEESIRLRCLAWLGVRWAVAVKPRIITLENVEEFLKWGPLHRTHSDGCPGVACAKNCRARKKRKVVSHSDGCPGVACTKGCRIFKPIKARQGETFRAFVRRLELLGYVVEWRLMRACDYGSPTSRRRLVLVARRDGLPIIWPEPTHGPGRGMPYRTAAECINWGDLGKSIFDEEGNTRHAEKTLARIAAGFRKYVAGEHRPFIVPMAYGTKGGQVDGRMNDIDDPAPTVCGNRGGHALVTPYLVHRSNGERPGQTPRTYAPERPLGTVVAQGQKHAAVAALLIKHNGGHNDDCGSAGQDLREPVHTIATRDQKALATVQLVASHLVKLRGTSNTHIASSASSVEDPVPTLSAGGTHVAAVHAFLVRYNGQSGPQQVDAPIGTLDTTDRYGLVSVAIDGEEYVVADIFMRMLTPRELFTAMGFPRDYVIDLLGPNGKILSKTAQIRLCGNAVCPQLMDAVVRAQLPGT